MCCAKFLLFGSLGCAGKAKLWVSVPVPLVPAKPEMCCWSLKAAKNAKMTQGFLVQLFKGERVVIAKLEMYR